MGISAKKLIGEWKKEEAFRKEYEKLEPEFWLARMLINARVRAGLTQAELARRMHTKQSVIARLEGGKQKPSFSTLEAFAKATGRELRIELVDVGGE